ncbi:hypothetical protein [Actinophytocola oryzae]|uniref:Uncharacterized protein n=1 Tax=Actinophytocola oryzae TaxID=502181 RepID=A0A4R7W3R5_9PSEU|nr:hypothetical protein [Actinophytocola oryzae]TDV56247.1 hypothetical protein CLV71_102313 [Actinophytocola oryzae]
MRYEDEEGVDPATGDAYTQEPPEVVESLWQPGSTYPAGPGTQGPATPGQGGAFGVPGQGGMFGGQPGMFGQPFGPVVASQGVPMHPGWPQAGGSGGGGRPVVWFGDNGSTRGESPVVRVVRAVEPVSVYTAADDGEALRDAVVAVLEVCGFDVEEAEEPQRGSWFQRLFASRGESAAVDKLVDVLHKVERAAELKHIAAPRSESDEREANAVARLAEALGDHDEVVVHLSSVLFVKSGGRVVARVLTEDEIRLLATRPELLRGPAEILDALAHRDTRTVANGAAVPAAEAVADAEVVTADGGSPAEMRALP